MQTKEKEAMKKDNSEKRSREEKHNSSSQKNSITGKNQNHQTSGTGHKDTQPQHGGQRQNSQNKSQHSANHGSNQNWKNQNDESEIENPEKFDEDDDADRTQKKIPQMNKQQDKSKF